MRKTTKKAASNEISVPAFRKYVRSLVNTWNKLQRAYEKADEKHGADSKQCRDALRALEKHEALLDKISSIADELNSCYSMPPGSF